MSNHPQIPDIIHSRRLVIRTVCPDDRQQYLEASLDTFDQIKAWFGPWAKEEPTEESLRQMIEQSEKELLAGESITYLCFLRETGDLVGRAFISKLDWSVPKGMLGYWINRRFQYQGFGTELVRALVRMVFQELEFQRLELYVDPRNEPAVRFADKCDFSCEGRIRNYGYDNFGTMRDYLIYSMVSEDYRAIRLAEHHNAVMCWT